MPNPLDKYRAASAPSQAAPSSDPLSKYRATAPASVAAVTAPAGPPAQPRWTPGTSEDPAEDTGGFLSGLNQMLGSAARPWEADTNTGRLLNMLQLAIPSAIGRGVRAMAGGSKAAAPVDDLLTKLKPRTGTGTPTDIPLGPATAPLKATTTAMPLKAPPAAAPSPLAARTGTGSVVAPPSTGTRGWSMPAATSAKTSATPVIRAPLSQAAKAADEIAEQVGPQQAAAAIEQKVKLSVTELATAMRTRYGSERAGNMLFGNSKGGNVIDRFARKDAIKRLAPGPSRTPQIVEELRENSEILKRFMDPKGVVNPKLAAGIGTTIAGGAAGATIGETTEDRIENGLIGAGLGAVVVPMLAHAVAVGAPKAAQNALYTSVLSSPTSVFKAYLGAIGGSVAAATEKIAAGDVSAGQRILSSLFSGGSVGQFVAHLRHPKLVTGMAEDAPSVVGRIFGAGDAVARRAMAAGGISADDAARYTLSGAPTTDLGKEILGLYSRWFALRLPSTLFPRVGIQLLERGIERSPLGLATAKGINEGVSQGTKVARAAIGTAAAGAAYAGSEEVPTWAKPYLAAVSGVYGLPVAIGFAAKSGGAMAAVNEVARNMPFPQFGPGEALKQIGSGASLVPNLVRDAAVARDPYERNTSGDFFGRTKAKIPGLRETLPVRGRRVNIAGVPIADRSTPLSRVLSPAPSRNEPMKGIPDAVAKEIERLDVPINPPSFEKAIKIGSKEMAIPPALAEKAQRDHAQYVVPAVEKLLASPSYQAADDARKKRRLQTTINHARARGAAAAKVKLQRALRRTP